MTSETKMLWWQRCIAVLAMALIMAVVLSGPVSASGGSASGGGGGSAGGGGGNAGGMTSISMSFDNWGDFFNGALPQGRVTFLYSPDGVDKSLSIQVSNIKVPDGTVMLVETQELWVTSTGNAWSDFSYPVTIRQGKGALSLSTANGDNVTFLPPTAGQSTLYVWSQSPRVPLMAAILGHLF